MSASYIENFKTFDGLDNRRDLYYMLYRLGFDLPEREQAKRRAAFIRKLLLRSQVSLFSDSIMRFEACSLRDAYFALVAITNALGVPIETAAKLLEEEVRKQ